MPFKQRAPRGGKYLLKRLRDAGIDARNVTQNRQSGVYVVDFSTEDVDDFDAPGTDPARVWAGRICERLGDAEIVATHDAVADWRPHRPILTATVFVRLRGAERLRRVG